MVKARKAAPGKCGACGGIFDKPEMTRHLKKCLAQQPAGAGVEPAAAAPKGAKLLHILVEGQHSPEYWMHLEVPAAARLSDLDGFLRAVWLECCGHMSAFHIGEEMYEGEGGGELGAASMNVALGKVLRPGMKFEHEYDFGSTTHLALRVMAEREGPAAGRAVRVLARNEPPAILCECGKPATQVCGQCIWEDGGWLCDECLEKHECGDEMCLPVVNSPRVGVCGYTGPAADG